MAGSSDAGQRDTLIKVEDDESDKKVDDMPSGVCGPWKWFLKNPWERWPFLIFFAFGILTILWLVIYITGGSFAGYLAAGIAAVLMSLYGANHFRTLLGLKEEVDKLHKMNQNFRQENAQLTQEVDKLQKARVQLNGVETSLKQNNEKLKADLKKFQELDKHLKSLSGSSIEGLEKLTKSTDTIMKKWKESLITHERSILNKVFDEFAFAKNKESVSKNEFMQFIQALPEEYQQRYNQLGQTFEQIAGDDNQMDYDEFDKLVTRWVEGVALGDQA